MVLDFKEWKILNFWRIRMDQLHNFTVRAERILSRWVTNFFLEILGELLENFSPNITKYSIKNWSYWNLGESRNSGSHQFRPHWLLENLLPQNKFPHNHLANHLHVWKGWQGMHVHRHLCPNQSFGRRHHCFSIQDTDSCSSWHVSLLSCR